MCARWIKDMITFYLCISFMGELFPPLYRLEIKSTAGNQDMLQSLFNSVSFALLTIAQCKLLTWVWILAL